MKLAFIAYSSAFVSAQQRMCPENTEYGYCQFETNVPSHLPYQKSCEKFIQCDEYGRQFLCDCPSGLYYNHRDGACQWPDARECCMKEEDGLAHRPCKSFAGCELDEPTRPGYCDQTEERPLYLNDDSTCTGYVKCDNFGVQFKCECPDGLQWHRGACDWPREAPAACCMENGGANRPCP